MRSIKDKDGYYIHLKGKDGLDESVGTPSEIDTVPDFDIVDELAMLLTAVAEAAAKSGTKDVCEIIANDEYAQAHFASFSFHLKDKTGQEATLFEYAKTEDGARMKTIMTGDHNVAGWPVWNRIV